VAYRAIIFSKRSILNESRLYALVSLDHCALIRCAHKTPYLSVWLACTLSFILGLPSLGSSVAFSAATSIATIGLYISYGAHYHFVVNHEYSCFCLLTGLPILLRVIYRDDFVRGPFHLGKFSYPVALVAVMWIIFITIAFILPELNVS
jgi:amino acid transporter